MQITSFSDIHQYRRPLVTQQITSLPDFVSNSGKPRPYRTAPDCENWRNWLTRHTWDSETVNFIPLFLRGMARKILDVISFTKRKQKAPSLAPILSRDVLISKGPAISSAWRNMWKLSQLRLGSLPSARFQNSRRVIRPNPILAMPNGAKADHFNFTKKPVTLSFNHSTRLSVNYLRRTESRRRSVMLRHPTAMPPTQ